MAGAFGYDADTIDVSRMGELSLLPAVRKAPATPHRRRRHVMPASDQRRRRREALHVARVLAMSLR